MEALWDLWQQLLSLLDFILQDAHLKVHHRQQQTVSVYVQMLIDQVESVLLSVIAKNVLLFVCISKLHDFTAD